MTERCGWILPNGEFIFCPPWQHLAKARELPVVVNARTPGSQIDTHWEDGDCEGELFRKALGAIGLVKINDTLIDADSITHQQLKTLQSLFDLETPTRDIQFVGRLNIKLEVRLFLKLKNPDRLNMLSEMF